MPCFEDCADNAAGDFDHTHSPVKPVAVAGPTPPVARCGRTDGHGAHVYLETHGWRNGRKAWCGGNQNVIPAQVAEDGAR